MLSSHSDFQNSPARRDHRAVWILSTIFFFALAMRLIACWEYFFIDESQIYTNVFHYFKNRTIDPLIHDYPLYSYIVALGLGGYSVLMWLVGIFVDPTDIVGFYRLHSPYVLLPGRMVGVLFSMGTLWCVWKIGRIYFSFWVGVLAAAFLAISRVHLHYAGMTLPENAIQFFSAMNLFFCLKAISERNRKSLLFASLFAGLAAASKYNAALGIVPIVGVHLYLSSLENTLSHVSAHLKSFALNASTFVAVFLAVSPYWLLSPQKALGYVLIHQSRLTDGVLGGQYPPYLGLLHGMISSEGLLCLLLGLAVFLGLKNRNAITTILLATITIPFLIYGLLSTQKYHYYWSFTYPAFLVLCANASYWLFQQRNRVMARVGAFCVLAIFGVEAVKSVSFVYWKGQTDTRVEAKRWIENNIEDGSKVATVWYTPQLLYKPQVPWLLDRYGHNPLLAEAFSSPAYDLFSMEVSLSDLDSIHSDYLVVSSHAYDRFFTGLEDPKNPKIRNLFEYNRYNYRRLFEGQSKWKKIAEFEKFSKPRITIYRKVSYL